MNRHSKLHWKTYREALNNNNNTNLKIFKKVIIKKAFGYRNTLQNIDFWHCTSSALRPTLTKQFSEVANF